MRMEEEVYVFFQKNKAMIRMLEEVYATIFKKTSMFSLRNLSGKKTMKFMFSLRMVCFHLEKQECE